LGFADPNSSVADTTNVYTILAGNRWHFFNITSKYMYVYEAGQTTAFNTIVHYGQGQDIIIDPTDATGKINVNATVTATATFDSTTSRAWVNILNFPTTYPVRTTSTDSLRVVVMNLQTVINALDSIVVKKLKGQNDTVAVSNTSITNMNAYDWGKIKFSYRDTVNSTADTVSRLCDLTDTTNSMASLGFTKWWQMIMTTDDTIQVSSSPLFPANKIWIINSNESWTSERFDVTQTTNYYYKVLGTGTALVRCRTWGY
jgi:hypothetical protein